MIKVAARIGWVPILLSASGFILMGAFLNGREGDWHVAAGLAGFASLLGFLVQLLVWPYMDGLESKSSYLPYVVMLSGMAIVVAIALIYERQFNSEDIRAYRFPIMITALMSMMAGRSMERSPA